MEIKAPSWHCMGVLKSIQIGTIPVSLSHSMGYKSGTVGDYFSLELSATFEAKTSDLATCLINCTLKF